MIATKSVGVLAGLLCLLLWPTHAVAQQADWERHLPAELAKQIPMRRLGSPEEVASIIYFLCSPQASYVSGTEVHINGGQHV